jgi:hypothetical protein
MESVKRGLLRVQAAVEGRGKIVPWAVPGISPSAFPSSWSKAEIVGAGEAAERRFLVGGGLAGVGHTPGGRGLEPVVAWLVEELSSGR